MRECIGEMLRCIRQKPDSNTVKPRIRPAGGCLNAGVYATLNG